MKKYYMQPCVEAAQLQLSSIVLAGSPGGISGGGTTGGSGAPGTDPIPGE